MINMSKNHKFYLIGISNAKIRNQTHSSQLRGKCSKIFQFLKLVKTANFRRQYLFKKVLQFNKFNIYCNKNYYLLKIVRNEKL